MKEISRAIELKKELDALRPISKENELRIMQKFRLDWNYHSNSIEGNSLNYGETKALILFGITAQGKPLKDHFEVRGHDEAIKWVLDIVKEERPLSENFIRELHKLILKEPYKVDAITPDGEPTKKTVHIGEYKKTPNHVKTETGEIFRFATPEETPIMMAELIDWYRKKEENPETNPILLAAKFHYYFIRIHPFDDGNGRTVRILMNFILLKHGYPPVVIKTSDKAQYFSVLQQADAGDMEPFFDYIAKNLIESLAIMVKGARGESIEEDDDIDKEVALLERRLQEVGGKVKKFKSSESLVESLDLVIAPLVNRFIEKCGLFDKFYYQSKLIGGINRGNIFFNDISFTNKDSILDEIENQLEKEIGIMNLFINYQYLRFKRIGFGEHDFKCSLVFLFDEDEYFIKNGNTKRSYQKRYGESITDEEIQEIVRAEVNAHKDMIDKLIKEKNKSS